MAAGVNNESGFVGSVDFEVGPPACQPGFRLGLQLGPLAPVVVALTRHDPISWQGVSGVEPELMCQLLIMAPSRLFQD